MDNLFLRTIRMGFIVVVVHLSWIFFGYRPFARANRRLSTKANILFILGMYIYIHINGKLHIFFLLSSPSFSTSLAACLFIIVCYRVIPIPVILFRWSFEKVYDVTCFPTSIYHTFSWTGSVYMRALYF